MYRWRPGRLFWKLLLAMWFSMVLTILGAVAYFHLSGDVPPRSHVGVNYWAAKLVPLISACFAFLITGLALAWYLTRPLQHLRWALAQFASGRMDTRVKPLMGRRSDEIVDLAHDFDQMASQLQQLTESRKVLLHDISHELRSPLTRMQAAIGLMRQDPTLAEAMIGRIGRESERLDTLIEELLTLHRLEADAGKARRSQVDVVELFHAIAEDADFEARSASRAVRIETPARFVSTVDGELIYRAFENVVRNAIKFTGEGTTVEIACTTSNDAGALECSVADRGPGVPEDMLEEIFKPFRRLDIPDAASGTGLGLAIARRAFEMHGGSVKAKPRQGGGLMVTMTLPRDGGFG